MFGFLHLLKTFKKKHYWIVCWFFVFFFSVCYKFILRTQDLKTKKHHIPVVDRTPLEPPPVVVVVVGPPKVGKSTLIKCLIKNFTRQKLVEIRGPVTIVSGENKDTRNWNAYFTLLSCLAFRARMCSHSHNFWSRWRNHLCVLSGMLTIRIVRLGLLPF